MRDAQTSIRGRWSFSKIALAVLALAVSSLAYGNSNAATFPNCNTLVPDATGKLTPSVACQGIAGIGQSNPNAGDLNTSPGMFGQETWQLVQKFDVADPPNPGDPPPNINGNLNGFSFSSSNNNFSGTWGVSQAILGAWQYVAIILKDGNQDPIATLAYLIQSPGFAGSTTGSWDTPWAKLKKGEWEDLNSLSNAQLWVSGQIPLPAAAWLMLAGLGGLGLMSRRKAKAA